MAGVAVASASHRTAALWVPDWPVLAALSGSTAFSGVPTPARVATPAQTGVRVDQPVAVLVANRVLATSAAARAAGVCRDMTKRSAQQACPELTLLRRDADREAQAFEAVAQAVESVVAGIEIARPGLILLDPGGAARYYGGEAELAGELVEAVAEAGFEAQAAVADGLLAPILLARDLMTDSPGQVVLPESASAEFLAARPTSDLLIVCCDQVAAKALTELISLWARLGIHTLGQLAQLPPATMVGRFGELGQWAQRLARGADLRAATKRRFEAALTVEAELDPPAARVDVATFAARRLADELHGALTKRGLLCGLLRITAHTAEGRHERCWRMSDAAAGGLSPARITDRVRWQLDGWLTATKTRRTRDVDGQPAPIVRLALAAEEVFPAGTHQPSLWGAGAGGDERARRALERVQGLLGADAVWVAEVQGGRSPSERVHLSAFGEANEPERSADLPWPGVLPGPSPATVICEPCAVQLLDEAGRAVDVDRRTISLSARPAKVRVPGPGTGASEGTGSSEGDGSPRAAAYPAGAHPVATWAGPWPVPTRWWLGEEPQAWLQVLLQDGPGWLLCAGSDGWRVAAVYD